jgi:adenine phosphoribosyltransferase
MKNIFVSLLLLVATVAHGTPYPRDYLKSTIERYPHQTCENLLIYNLIEMYKDTGLMRHIVDRFSAQIKDLNPDYIANPEARALPILGAVTYNLNKPGIFIRKAGKIPAVAPRLTASYTTAYSTDTIEMTADPNLQGKTVVIIDDGISSGGTTLATIELLQRAGMRVIAIFAVVEHHYRARVVEYAPWESVTHTLFDL